MKHNKIYFILICMLIVSNVVKETNERKILLKSLKSPKVIDNKYSHLLDGCVKSIFNHPPTSLGISGAHSCLPRKWKFDTSTDAIDQAENLIIIFQILDNYNQYLVKEIDDICILPGFVENYFKKSWKHVKLEKYKLLIKREREDLKKPSEEDTFKKYGGFKKNTAYANKKLDVQTVYNIFNPLSRTTMASINDPKRAIFLREVVISAFNPITVLSFLLTNHLKRLFSSGLFQGILLSIECISMKLHPGEEKELKVKVERFQKKIEKLTNEKAIKIFSKLVCQWRAFLKLIKKFETIVKAKSDNEKFNIIGNVFGRFIKLIGTKRKN